uniref:Gastrula zinc finger protein XlCGF57.1-like isoform X3 n=1 Tax=Geotrypetes seraphini TaxID=260995 RepID=A0A6P8PZT1_GEOSA|nr:gastrula zinc finger protein XlCGF57.1-like isoform X3 [Geotrypetes seraphini]
MPAGDFAQVPITFEDIAIYFSQEEWEDLEEWQKKLYKEVMKENYQMLNSLEIESKRRHEVALPEELTRHLKATKTELEKERRDTCPCCDWGNNFQTQCKPEEGPRNSGRYSTENVTSCEQIAEGIPHASEQRNQIQKEQFVHNEFENCYMDQSPPKSHQRLHEGERPSTCTDCGVKFKQKELFPVSKKIHTNCGRPCPFIESGKFLQKQDLVMPKRTNTEKKPFVCSECGHSFSRKGHLHQHQRVHTGERPFVCSECGKSFSKKFCLQQHLRVHTGEKPFPCSECGKGFTHKAHLTRHLSVHTGEKPFVCSQCGNSFSNKSYLQRHFRVHTAENPFPCQECGKEFKQKRYLAGHLKIHTGHLKIHTGHLKIHTRDRLFSCPDCGKGFVQETTFLRHQDTHRAERPFLCRECGKCFRLKEDILDHLKMHW